MLPGTKVCSHSLNKFIGTQNSADILCWTVEAAEEEAARLFAAH